MTLRTQLIRLTVLCTVGYAAYAGLAWGRQTDIVFPGRSRAPEPVTDRVEAGTLRLQPGDPARHARLFRSATPDAPLVVIAHGNGELISDWFPDAADLARRGPHVLLVEYPGYGGLPGEPGQTAIRAAFEEGLDAALETLAPARPRVIGLGYSIGAAVIADLSRTRPLDGMVLHAPFRSLRHMAARRGLPPPLVRDRFDTLGAVRAFAGPVIVVHGLADPIIPADEGRAVAAAAGQGTFVGVPGSGHDAGLEDWEAVVGRVIGLGRAPAPPSAETGG